MVPLYVVNIFKIFIYLAASGLLVVYYLLVVLHRLSSCGVWAQQLWCVGSAAVCVGSVVVCVGSVVVCGGSAVVVCGLSGCGVWAQ